MERVFGNSVSKLFAPAEIQKKETKLPKNNKISYNAIAVVAKPKTFASKIPINREVTNRINWNAWSAFMGIFLTKNGGFIECLLLAQLSSDSP